MSDTKQYAGPPAVTQPCKSFAAFAKKWKVAMAVYIDDKTGRDIVKGNI